MKEFNSQRSWTCKWCNEWTWLICSSLGLFVFCIPMLFLCWRWTKWHCRYQNILIVFLIFLSLPPTLAEPFMWPVLVNRLWTEMSYDTYGLSLLQRSVFTPFFAFSLVVTMEVMCWNDRSQRWKQFGSWKEIFLCKKKKSFLIF